MNSMASHELPSSIGAGAASGENHVMHLDDPPEPAPITDFLVQFMVSGLMFVHASDPLQANERATAFLQGLPGKTGTPGLPTDESGQVKLGETTVVIDDVQALEFPQELPNLADHENS
jgi:hypothetical protein